MASRVATCSCGQLRVTCEGEPARISMCHCLECQRRTGGAFGGQARFRRDQVSIVGNSTEYVRSSDSGDSVNFRFCPNCGSTVFWERQASPDFIIVAVGAFADPTFPAPKVSVWEEGPHDWLGMLADMPIEHLTKG
jgi:hypothetical protein